MLKFIPALSSLLIVGLGQIIKGSTEKGLIIFLIFYFAIPLFLHALLIAASGRIFLIALSFTAFFMPALWVYSIIDTVRGG